MPEAKGKKAIEEIEYVHYLADMANITDELTDLDMEKMGEYFAHHEQTQLARCDLESRTE